MCKVFVYALVAKPRKLLVRDIVVISRGRN